VYLKPYSKGESSSYVMALYDEETWMYRSSFDLGDYQTIVPNTDTYHIVIVLDSNLESLSEYYCGRGLIDFGTSKEY